MREHEKMHRRQNYALVDWALERPPALAELPA